jgi:outer membrane protein OmpA-like peptidoglycan-associated protein
MTRLVSVSVLGTLLAVATPSLAQTPAAKPAAAPQSASATSDTRPATTTTDGDTGLWFVPTAEVLAPKKISFSVQRTNMDDGQGFADISQFPITFGAGLAKHAEIFGSFDAVTRIDRDTRPLFFTSTATAGTTGTGGGLLANYPLDQSGWVSSVGDLRVGAKINLLSQADRKPAALALRGIVKIPTGSKTNGTTTGKADFSFDAVVSHRNNAVEVSGYGGFLVRGNPAGYTLPKSVRWGFGAAMPQKYSVRLTTELFGEHYSNNTITAPAGLTASDGSIVPTSTTLKDPVILLVGLTWQMKSGFFVGAAGSLNLHMSSRSDAACLSCGATFSDVSLDKAGLQVRVGFHPGVRQYVPPPPPNLPPTVKASCDPCTVEAGKTSTVSAAATDPENDPLTYQWQAERGTLAAPTNPRSSWTAPMQPGPVKVTVTVSDGHNPAVSDSVTITVEPPPNHPPTVKAMCDPCSVEAGQMSTVSADAQDPDGDPLTYQWTAPTGALGNATSRQSTWTAPMQPGAVPITITVNDGHGHTASDTVTIQVARKVYTFEDVHFDFDRYSLLPDALRVLDEAVAAMQADPTLRLEIEGHTCDIGTAEYNLALGERRAGAVRDYLVSRGISADRLHTTSYGEENPKYDNSREETRRLNRRAALVVKLVGGGQ